MRITPYKIHVQSASLGSAVTGGLVGIAVISATGVTVAASATTGATGAAGSSDGIVALMSICRGLKSFVVPACSGIW